MLVWWKHRNKRKFFFGRSASIQTGENPKYICRNESWRRREICPDYFACFASVGSIFAYSSHLNRPLQFLEVLSIFFFERWGIVQILIQAKFFTSLEWLFLKYNCNFFYETKFEIYIFYAGSFDHIYIYRSSWSKNLFS